MKETQKKMRNEETHRLQFDAMPLSCFVFILTEIPFEVEFAFAFY